MENQKELILKYFEGRKIAFKESSYESCSFHAQFSSSSRLQDCRISLIPDGRQLQINLTLPIRVKRAEAYTVCRELALINEEMPEYAGYIIDPLNGAVKMIVCVDAPNDEEDLDARLKAVIGIAEEDIESIMDSVIQAKTAIEQAEEESKKKDDAPPPKTPTVADRLLEFIGLYDPERIPDED